MTPLILLLTLFSLLVTALPAAPIDAVTVEVFQNPACAPDFGSQTIKTNVSEASGCVAFPFGVDSLRVTKVTGQRVRYNSLRVYKGNNCTGGWTLEPALTCAGPGGRGCACSRVIAFGSIQLVVD